jgi:hypothetical protein
LLGLPPIGRLEYRAAARYLGVDHHYARHFTDNEVDFALLLEMADTDLKDIGIRSWGARKKETHAVNWAQPIYILDDDGSRESTAGSNVDVNGDGLPVVVLPMYNGGDILRATALDTGTVYCTSSGALWHSRAQ